MNLGKKKVELNTVLWRRLPERVRPVVLAFTLCAGSEGGILHCKRNELEWAAKPKELEWALSWLLAADLAHYCDNRYHLNPTLGHEKLEGAESSLFEKWASLISIPF